MSDAPRVTPEDVDAAIVGETYTVLPDGRTTVCQLTLDNGFTVEGFSACVSKENFNAEVGNAIARERAIAEVWKLLGFRLADAIHDAATGLEPSGTAKRTFHRCAKDGYFVSEQYARENPDTTVRETR